MFLLTVAPLAAEIVDRVAVAIGNQVITESELVHQIRLKAFLEGQKPDVGPASKRETAQRLIEQKLVKKEMDLGHYTISEPAEAQQMVDNLKKMHGVGFAQQLRANDLTEADLLDHFEWGLTLSNFIDLRFRPAIQVTAEDIEKYFREDVRSKDKNANLDDIRDKIRQTLTAQRADEQMAAWLKDTLSHTRIDYKDEALQ